MIWGEVPNLWSGPDKCLLILKSLSCPPSFVKTSSYSFISAVGCALVRPWGTSLLFIELASLYPISSWGRGAPVYCHKDQVMERRMGHAVSAGTQQTEGLERTTEPACSGPLLCGFLLNPNSPSSFGPQLAPPSSSSEYLSPEPRA